jgi:hypothetical protein
VQNPAGYPVLKVRKVFKREILAWYFHPLG